MLSLYVAPGGTSRTNELDPSVVTLAPPSTATTQGPPDPPATVPDSATVPGVAGGEADGPGAGVEGDGAGSGGPGGGGASHHPGLHGKLPTAEAPEAGICGMPTAAATIPAARTTASVLRKAHLPVTCQEASPGIHATCILDAS